MVIPVPSISCGVLNHHNLFYQIQNALAFNWDMCCHLALCLWLLPFHCTFIVQAQVQFEITLVRSPIRCDVLTKLVHIRKEGESLIVGWVCYVAAEYTKEGGIQVLAGLLHFAKQPAWKKTEQSSIMNHYYWMH
jgi:hypothetical protein